MTPLNGRFTLKSQVAIIKLAHMTALSFAITGHLYRLLCCLRQRYNRGKEKQFSSQFIIVHREALSLYSTQILHVCLWCLAGDGLVISSPGYCMIRDMSRSQGPQINPTGKTACFFVVNTSRVETAYLLYLLSGFVSNDFCKIIILRVL